jgi:AraC-like DNA-binding protein
MDPQMYKVRAIVLNGFEELVRRLGANPLALLHESNIDPFILENPDALIPASVFSSLLEKTAEVTGCNHFGLLLSKQRNLNAFGGVVVRLMESSSSLEIAINAWIKHLNITKQGVPWHLLKNDQVTHFTRQTDMKMKGSTVQSTQLGVATCWRILRLVSGNRWHPSMVCFAFNKPTDTLPYRRFFDVPVTFNADFDGIVFHSNDLKLVLPTHDAKLHDMLNEYADSLDLPHDYDFRKSVKEIIEKNLNSGICNIESIVQFFPFERRTLQRKLSAKGVSYLQLLGEVRYEKATHYLQNTNITLTQLAEMLGYDDLSAFTKAFKKKTGQPPRDWRRQNQNLDY